MAKIDILLPVKNGVHYLAESISSIQAQEFTDWRLLVLDHGSTDGSKELADEIAVGDGRIEVRDLRHAIGLAGLLNFGLDLCTAEYVMRHDADDVCLPKRMTLSLEGFLKNPGCIAVSGQAEAIDGDGTHTGWMRRPVGRQRITAASFFCNPIIHPAVMLHRERFNAVGARFGKDFLGLVPLEKTIRVDSLAEDYFLFGQLALLGRCVNLPDQLIRYRWHDGNVSVTRFNDQMNVSVKVSRFLADSFSILHGIPSFDPVPFCNHGGLMFHVEGQTRLRQEFKSIRRNLTRAMGMSSELVRELDFREVLAVRNRLLIIWSYWRFTRRYTPETGEWYTIKSSFTTFLPGRPKMVYPRIAADGA